MRIVLDANVLISSLITSEGVSSKVVQEIVNNERYTLLMSHAIADKVRRVLTYPKLKKYLIHPQDYLENWLSALITEAHVVSHHFHYPPIVIEDPDDDMYMITAIEGKADCIISGDQHLLKMNPYQGIYILNPSEFLKLNRNN